MRSSFAMLATAFALSALSALGCGGSESGANSPSRALPAYSGHEAELFDDGIDPKAVGLDYDGALDPRLDTKFRERAQVSDAILRAKVDTVTERGEGAQARYDIAFKTLEKLGGENAPPADFTLHIEGTSPSAGIVRTMQTSLGGKSFVTFVREFRRADGEAEWHFHLSPDTKEAVSAARDAMTAFEMK
jgi:hypothetical protein